MKTIILGITGASGAFYARRLLDLLEKAGTEVHVIITENGAELLREELHLAEVTPLTLLDRNSPLVHFHDNSTLRDPLASGSNPVDAMVVCPCSSHTLAAIAGGLANSLLLRAAYVSLKERRPLLLVHRETPVTAIDLENMLRVSRAGGLICPAAPPFYLNPRSIGELVDAFLARILDLLHIEHDLPVRWAPD